MVKASKIGITFFRIYQEKMLIYRYIFGKNFSISVDFIDNFFPGVALLSALNLEFKSL